MSIVVKRSKGVETRKQREVWGCEREFFDFWSVNLAGGRSNRLRTRDCTEGSRISNVEDMFKNL